MAATTYKNGNLYQLGMNSVQPDPGQPRKYFDPPRWPIEVKSPITTVVSALMLLFDFDVP